MMILKEVKIITKEVFVSRANTGFW